MPQELRVRVIISSSSEEVLGWKCINLQDMNLEVHVINQGRDLVRIKSQMELVGNGEAEKVDYFFPYGLHPLGPGQGLSFYCHFEEDRFKRFTGIIIEDDTGNHYQAPITGRSEPARRL